MITDVDLGLILKAWRTRRGYSQAEIAHAVPGWHPTTVAKIESGDRSLKAKELPLVANKLGIQPGDFFNAKDLRAFRVAHLAKLKEEIKRLQKEAAHG